MIVDRAWDVDRCSSIPATVLLMTSRKRHEFRSTIITNIILHTT
jgi:hypothetical protein